MNKTMNFFWSANPMSWLRYLTLASFRRYHPDWKMVLHTTDDLEYCFRGDDVNKPDYAIYDGVDYWMEVSDLDIEVRDWKPQEGKFPHLRPAQASDVCEWEVLSGDGGFFADMDILFIKPIPYDEWKGADVIYCFFGKAAIGFFGASPSNPLFRSILASAEDGHHTPCYQSTGVEAFYRMGRLSSHWLNVHRPGDKVMDVLRARHYKLGILQLDPNCFYPWLNGEMFTETLNAPDECIGIHWFGGTAVAQEANATLTESNYRDFPCTITHYIEALEL